MEARCFRFGDIRDLGVLGFLGLRGFEDLGVLLSRKSK